MAASVSGMTPGRWGEGREAAVVTTLMGASNTMGNIIYQSS